MKQILNLIIIALIFILCGSIAGCKTDENKKEKRAMNDEYKLLVMDQIHRKKLQEIQYWSMKKGVAQFYKTRDASHIAEYVKSRGYGLVLQPQVDKYHTHEGRKIHTLVRFVIQQKYMINQLWCLEQVEHNGIIYEYWVMQEKSQGRQYSQSYRNCTFMVTRADGLTGEREIIHSAEQFLGTYKISEDFSLVFPKERITQLRVYAYPEHFRDTEIKEIKDILSRLK